MSDFIIENGVLVKYTGQDECVVIPDGVTLIRSWAIRGVNDLDKIIFSDSVEKVEKYAISDCPKLKYVELSENTTRIDYDALPYTVKAKAIFVRSKKVEKLTEYLEHCTRQLSNQYYFWYAELRNTTKKMAMIILYQKGELWQKRVDNIIKRTKNEDLLSDIMCELIQELANHPKARHGNLFTTFIFNYLDKIPFEQVRQLYEVLEEGKTKFFSTITSDKEFQRKWKACATSADEMETLNKMIQNTAKKAETNAKRVSGPTPWKTEQLPDGTLKINYYKGTDRIITVPNMINNKRVTVIGEGAFCVCRMRIRKEQIEVLREITEVNITPGIEIIEEYAFRSCNNLSKIILPEGLQRIGSGAFDECWNLEQVTIPGTVMGIGDYAFVFCLRLEKVEISEGVTNIGKKTFYNCKNIKKITIPQTVIEIGDSAFEHCILLEKVNISEGVTRIGERAFFDCENLKDIEIPESVTEIGKYVFHIRDSIVGEGRKRDDLTIHAKPNSYAHKYAQENDIKFEAI